MNRIAYKDSDGTQHLVELVLISDETLNEAKLRICEGKTFLWLFYSK